MRMTSYVEIKRKLSLAAAVAAAALVLLYAFCAFAADEAFVGAPADEVTYSPQRTIWFDKGTIPHDGNVFALGQPFCAGGTVYSLSPIKDVIVKISDAVSGRTLICVEARGKDLGKYEYSLSGYAGSINSRIKFSKLNKGRKRIEVICSNADETDAVLWKADFFVEKFGKLAKNVIHNNGYNVLRDFFGDDSFLFSYRVDAKGSRHIIVDQKWINENIVTMKYGGKTLRVNRRAYDNFKRAFEHVDNTFVRVDYETGSSGVFALRQLIRKNGVGGAFVPRFQRNSMDKISHHSFGTCIDINPSLKINTKDTYGGAEGTDRNWNAISSALSKLEYIGIRPENGKSVYCFRYDGKKPRGLVPDALNNYFLFELAFKREGFFWGGYFGRNVDAMHFTLTEPNDSHMTYPRWSDATPDHAPVDLVGLYAEDINPYPCCLQEK